MAFMPKLYFTNVLATLGDYALYKPWGLTEVDGIDSINRRFLMPKYEVAHIREQGQDMIIFPLEARYGHLSQADQERELDVLQLEANRAGLRGAAVAVWDAGGGRMASRGPHQWQAFLQSISLPFVRANLNKVISW